MFERIIYQMGIKEAVRQGHLCRVQPPVEIKIDGLRLRQIPVVGNDFVEAELQRAVNNTNIAEQLADAYIEHASGRRAVIFTTFVDQARRTYLELKRRKIPAAWVSGDTDIKVFEETMQALREGRIMVVSNANLLTEGWDEPMVSCVINGRPTKSRAIYTQMIGRGTRLCEDIEDKNLLVIDTVGEDTRDVMKAADIFGDEVYGGIGQKGEVATGSLVQTVYTSRPITWKKANKYTYFSITPGGMKVSVSQQRDGLWAVKLMDGTVDVFHNREMAIGTGADLMRRLGDRSIYVGKQTG
jgi:hypothetical protein